jgi:hypothetical protein
MNQEKCSLCGCVVNRSGNYAIDTGEGQSHANAHHLVARRLRPFVQGTSLASVTQAPVFCYVCGEVILHNPPLMLTDLGSFANLVRTRGIDALPDGERATRIIQLFHEIIAAGLGVLTNATIGNGASQKVELA